MTCVQDVFTLIPAAEIRALREESPSNLATMCYKAVEKLVLAAESGCPSQTEQQTGILKGPFIYLKMPEKGLNLNTKVYMNIQIWIHFGPFVLGNYII